MSASKSVVIYHSKYGSTKKYAEWISQKTESALVQVSEFNPQNLKNYSTIIFGSFAYMGKMKAAEFIINNLPLLQDKRLFLFCVSAAPPDGPEHKKILNSTFSPDIQKQFRYFPLHGAYNYSRMDNTDKMIMQVPKFLMWLKWKTTQNSFARKFLDEFYTPQDWTDPDFITPLVTEIQRS